MSPVEDTLGTNQIPRSVGTPLFGVTSNEYTCSSHQPTVRSY